MKEFVKTVCESLFGMEFMTEEESEKFWEAYHRNVQRNKEMEQAEATSSQSKPKSPTKAVEEIDLKKAVDDLLGTKKQSAEEDQKTIEEKINQPYDDKGFTLLHCAAQEGKKEEVERLLENGADPKAKAKDGSTSLHEAIQAASTAKVYASDIVTLLLQKDINGDIINAKNNLGEAPIHLAMRLSRAASDIVGQLMQHDSVDLTIKDNKKNTPLHTAACVSVNNTRNVEQLLRKVGSITIDDRNADGQSALELAIINNHSDGLINLLVESGANVNAALQNETGRHLIHLAAMDAQLDTIKILYDSKRLDIDVSDAQGFTAFHRVIEAWSRGSQVAKPNWLEKRSKLFRKLKDKTGDIESTDIWKAVALDLRSKQANVNTQNQVGNTPLHTMFETGSIGNIEPIMQFLLDNKANKTIRNQDENSPLQYGAAWGVPICIMAQLESQNPDIIAANSYGDTLLHYACSQKSNMGWVKCLLEEYTLDPNRKNKQGLSPYLIVKCLLREVKSEADKQYLQELSNTLRRHQAIMNVYVPADKPLPPLALKSNYEDHRPSGWFKRPVQQVDYSEQNTFDFFSDTSGPMTEVTDTEGEYSVVVKRP